MKLRTIITLLLFLAAALLWHRGRQGADVLAFFAGSGKISAAASWRGEILFTFTNIPFGQERAYTLASARIQDADMAAIAAELLSPPRIQRERFGFSIAYGEKDTFGITGGKFYAVGVPHWFIMLLCLFGFAPPMRRAWIMRQRRKRGLCLQCGYDIRASTDRCPECGAPILARA